jgi:hypothetical protein
MDSSTLTGEEAREARDARERAEYIEGLRMLAEVLDKHTGIPLPFTGRHSNRMTIRFGGTPEDVAAMAAAAKAFPCSWVKHYSGGGEHTDWLDLHGQLAGVGIELYAPRDAVCVRVVVGTEDREVDEVVTPAVVKKVTKPVEIVRWECGSILRPDADESAPVQDTAAETETAAA